MMMGCFGKIAKQFSQNTPKHQKRKDPSIQSGGYLEAMDIRGFLNEP